MTTRRQHMKLEYVRKGDYFYPNLTIGYTESRPIGIWGIRRKNYFGRYDLVQSARNGYDR